MKRVYARLLAVMVLAGGIALALAERNDALVSMTDVQLVTSSGVRRLRLEVAQSEEARLQGLMDRTELHDDGGMLFVYLQPQLPRSGFWMYRTHIPLDLAFLNERGVIIATFAMEPCASPEPLRCPSYYSPAPYRFALEVKGGYFRKHGIAVGDRAVFSLPDQ